MTMLGDILAVKRFTAPGGGGGGSYTGRSVIFDRAQSQYASRTPASAGNTSTYTISLWTKLSGSAGTWRTLLEARTGTAKTALYVDTSERLYFYNFDGASATCQRITTRVLRDYSGWLHIVIAVDLTLGAVDNSCRVYINGSEVTTFDTKVNGTTAHYVNAAVEHRLGGSQSSEWYDGYVAEAIVVDGQQLTPSSFGQVDSTSGEWVWKAYSGSYGTNGFRLDFSDTTSFTTVFNDKSGNANHFTPTGYSGTVTDYAVLDTMEDNHAAFNPLRKLNSPVFSRGNRKLANASASYAKSTLALSIPDVASSTEGYYLEFHLTGTASDNVSIGLLTPNSVLGNSAGNAGLKGIGSRGAGGGSTWWLLDGTTYGSDTGIAHSTSDIVSLAVKNGKLWFAINNTWVLSGDPAAGTNPAHSGLTGMMEVLASIYQNDDIFVAPDTFTYTPPTGFTALTTANLPAPSIANPADDMAVALYTGMGSAQSITGLNFQPDLVWLKDRSAANSHHLFDSVRGVTKLLQADNTGAEATDANSLTAFNTDGFSIGTRAAINTSGNNYVSWNWKKGATPGLDIVNVASTGSAQTLPHSLGKKPACMIMKNRSVADAWYTYFDTAAVGATKTLKMDVSNAVASSTVWGNTEPTASQFTVNPGTSGYDSIVYLFAAVEGFSAFGQYTGNGSADGPFIYCGFRPAFVLTKRTDAAADWVLLDTARDPYNQAGQRIWPDLPDAEITAGYTDMVANGFKLRTTNTLVNASGGTYVYMAFAEAPFKYARGR